MEITPTTRKILASVCHSCLAIAGSPGNVLPILVIFHTSNLKAVGVLLISDVALADLMVTSAGSDASSCVCLP